MRRCRIMVAEGQHRTERITWQGGVMWGGRWGKREGIAAGSLFVLFVQPNNV